MQPSTPSAGIGTFGHDLIAELSRRRPEANLVVSPASIVACFAMLRLGAGGGTAAQIDDVLHLSADVGGSGFAGLAGQWAFPQLSFGHGVWLQESLQVREAYVRAVERDFGAVVRRVDFDSPDAVDEINAWVSRQTHGQIASLLDELPDDAGALLASAVHLRASWRRCFEPADTAERPFHLADGSEVAARTMSVTATLDHARDGERQAVRLPYADCDLALWVLLPPSGEDPVDLLAPALLDRVRDRATPRQLALRLPTWRVRSDLDLRAPLTALGLAAPFASDADLAALSPDLRGISRVAHRAVIAVDEEGTVAAAVTGIVARLVSARVPDATMQVDRPFAYTLVHEPTGVPLFSGVVRDPR